jgi:RNA polymerase sigma factor (sigma-70 family)
MSLLRVKYRTLSPEEERALGRLLRSGDTTARDRLIESRMSQALDRAKRAAGPNLPIEDACTVAKIAVIRAVDRYDPDRGDLASYVGNCVHYALVRALHVNLTARAKDEALRAKYRAERMEGGTRRRAGLDAGDRVFSASSVATVKDAEPELARMRQQLLARLPRQQRSLIAHRLDGGTLAEWAQSQDPPVSTPRASQILSSAGARLRELLTGTGPSPLDAPRRAVTWDETPSHITVKVDIDAVIEHQRKHQWNLTVSGEPARTRSSPPRTFRRTGYPSDRGSQR